MNLKDERLQKVQSLAGDIASLRKRFRKTPSYQLALQIQRKTRAREALVAELRRDFEVVVGG